MAPVKSGQPGAALLHQHPAAHVHPERHHAASPRHRPARQTRLPLLWHFAAEYLLLLPLGAAIALVWANLAPESYFRTTFAIDFAVNDVAMVLFFGLIMKEVAEATAPGGVLHPWRRAALPLVAALGLTIMPALVYRAVVPIFDEPRMLEGWPAVFAVDLALGYFLTRVLFGRHPAVPFFVLIAICANGLAVIALATAGAAAHARFAVVLPLMAGAAAAALALRRARIRSFWPYVLIGGSLSWCGLYFGGFAPALALVPIVPFLPHARRDPGFFIDAAPDAHDALSRFERWCRHPAQVALFLSGLVNAGVPLKALYWGTWSLPVATLFIKPVGLLLGVGLALALGLHLPRRVAWRELIVVGFLSTIGFSMALFIAAAALGPGPVQSAVKMGALVSSIGGVLACTAAAVLRTGRFSREPASPHGGAY
jgi:Na+:H+ antiporter, NhaA family